jgi:hypothetical protein
MDGGSGILIGGSSDDARSGGNRKFIIGLAGDAKPDASRTQRNRTYRKA